MTQFNNDPVTAHPLADQAEWWATDKSTKDAEAALNQKTSAHTTAEQSVLEQSKTTP